MEQRRFRFGAIDVLPGRRKLLVAGAPVDLGARAFDVLVALAERHDRVVPRSELLDIVWPGVVVEENNLSVQIWAIRKLLGPHSVATIPGRGYRLTLEVSEPPATDARATIEAAATTHPGVPTLPDTVHGRDDDAATIEGLVRQHRLLTVTGAGGIGKTTLVTYAAQSLGQHHGQGLAWIDLSPLSDGQIVAELVARALKLPAAAGANMAALVDALRSSAVLIVLDNAEHLVDAIAQFARLVLAAAPSVSLLVTSQAPLRVTGERVFRLGTLELPEGDAAVEQALRHGAVALFVDLARSADRQFELNDGNVATVIRLCRRLDGLPLALKLAAARLRLFGLEGLEARLAERFKLLGGVQRDAPTRQQTLRAALDWSVSLLSEHERTVFSRLGVFVGSFPLEAAVEVAGGDEVADEWQLVDTLGMLIDRSLLSTDASAPPRLRLLESAREYALLELERAQAKTAAQRCHAQAMLRLIETAQAGFWQAADVKDWLRLNALEIDNLRTAIDWATVQEPALAAALLGAAGRLFGGLSLSQEYRRRCERLDPHVQAAVATPALARYWLERSRMMLDSVEGTAPGTALLAVRMHRDLGDTRGLFTALGFAALSTLYSPVDSLAMVAEMRRIEQTDWPLRLRHVATAAEAITLQRELRFAEACVVVRRELALARAAGNEALEAVDLNFLADATLGTGEPDAAAAIAREALVIDTARGSANKIHSLSTLVTALVTARRAPAAREALMQFIDESRAQDWYILDVVIGPCALLAALEGRMADAAMLLGYGSAGPLHGAAKYPNEARAKEAALTVAAASLSPADLERLRRRGAATLNRSSAAMLALAPPGGVTARA